MIRILKENNTDNSLKYLKDQEYTLQDVYSYIIRKITDYNKFPGISLAYDSEYSKTNYQNYIKNFVKTFTKDYILPAVNSAGNDYENDYDDLFADVINAEISEINDLEEEFKFLVNKLNKEYQDEYNSLNRDFYSRR